jgi:two-component system, LytTR family, response regulator
MAMRALIVDDEELARRALRRLLGEHPGIEVVGECADGASAVTMILEQQPDLIFLDVQMPEMSGFDVIRRVGVDRMPATVFVTAYDEYAVSAFDANAVDYLLKPIARQRFARALARVHHDLAAQLSVEKLRSLLAGLQGAAVGSYLERIPVAEDGRIVFVDTDDVAWIGASGNYARLHAGSRTYEVRETLTSLEAKLDPRRFARIHRSTIVNVRRVKEVQPWFHGHHVVILQTGERLRLSRYQRAAAKLLGVS